MLKIMREMQPQESVNRELCERGTCHFRDANFRGEEKCLLEYVRRRWKNPSAPNYCCDPQAEKFVEYFHRNSLKLNDSSKD